MKLVRNKFRILGKGGLTGLVAPAGKMAKAVVSTILKNSGLKVHGKVWGWKVELQVSGSSISIHLRW